MAALLLTGALLLCTASTPKTPPPALHTAAGTGAIDEVKALLANGGDVHEVDGRGEPALMHAAWGGHAEVVQMLLDAGASPNPQDRNGDYPLLFAAFQGHLPIIQALCAKPDIDPNLQNKNGFTALLIAIVRRTIHLHRVGSQAAVPDHPHAMALAPG
jgi:ankyrin repeat protein